MAFSVKVPKEIEDYQEKIFAGLSARKLISFSAALVCAAIVFVVCKFLIGMSVEVSGYLVMFAVIPPLAFGFFKKNGYYFEDYLPMLLHHYFGKQVRVYCYDYYSMKDMIKNKNRKEKDHAKSKRKFSETTWSICADKGK